MDQQPISWEHCLEHAALSDIGLRRANNQDAMAVVIAGSQETWQQRGHLFMVADGMGAHAAGELASKLAADAIPLSYFKLLDQAPPQAILTATEEANTQIHSRGRASPDFTGMGTTSTTMLLLPQGALLAHVGDSRAYRLRGDRYEQLTFDHSLIWEMRAAGKLPEKEVPPGIPKNIITRSLGPNPTVEVDLEGPFPLEAGDTFLLCSDGLSGPVKDEEMGAIIGCLPPAEAVRSLVDLANLRGGPDNITVVVVRVIGPQVGRTSGTDPVSSEAASTTRPVHPLIWTLLGVSVLATAGLLLIGQTMTALVSLLAALVLLLAAVLRRYGGSEPGPNFGGRLLGKGPYACQNRPPDGEFVGRLVGIVEQLRDAAVQQNWSLDWSRLNGFLGRAKAADEAGTYAEAVREYFHAISLIMAELKRRRNLADEGTTTA